MVISWGSLSARHGGGGEFKDMEKSPDLGALSVRFVPFLSGEEAISGV